MKTYRKVLSVILAIMMVVSLLPANFVFAADETNHVLKFPEVESTQHAYYNNWAQITNGEKYTLTFKIKGEGTIRIGYNNWGNGPITEKYTVSSAEWVTVTRYYTGNQDIDGGWAAMFIYRDPDVDGVDNTGTVYIDDISVKDSAGTAIGGKETFDFENGTDGWTGSDWSWSQIQVVEDPTLNPDDYEGINPPIDIPADPIATHTGTHAFNITLDGSQWGTYAVQEVTLQPNTTYVASARMKADQENIKVTMNYLNGWVTALAEEKALTNDWATYTFTFTTGDSVDSAMVGVYTIYGVDTTVYLDDFSLKAEDSGEELIANGGFDSGREVTIGGSESEIQWDDWITKDNKGHSRVIWLHEEDLDADGTMDNGALKFELNADNRDEERFALGGLSLEVGKSYVLTAWFRGEEGGEKVRFRFLNEYQPVTMNAEEELTLTTEWTQHYLKIENVSSAWPAAGIYATVGMIGTIYMDDISFKEDTNGDGVGDGPELFGNGGFESGDPFPGGPRELAWYVYEGEPAGTADELPGANAQPDTAIAFDANGVFTDDFTDNVRNDRIAVNATVFENVSGGTVMGAGGAVVYKLPEGGIKGFKINYDSLYDWKHQEVAQQIEDKAVAPKVYTATWDAENGYVLSENPIETVQLYRVDEMTQLQYPKWEFVSADLIPEDAEYLYVQMPGAEWYKDTWAMAGFALTSVEIYDPSSVEEFYDYTVDVTDQVEADKKNYSDIFYVAAESEMGRPGYVAKGGNWSNNTSSGTMYYEVVNQAAPVQLMIQGLYGETEPTAENDLRLYWIDESGTQTEIIRDDWRTAENYIEIDEMDSNTHRPVILKATIPEGAVAFKVQLTGENNRILNVAYTNAVKGINKEALKAALNQSNALVEEEYTPNSWTDSNIKTVTPAGQEVYENLNATKDDVDAATQAILDAIAKLVKRADTSGLEDAIADAGELEEEDYDPESWKDLEDAVDEGEKVKDDPNATQDEVDDAEEAIREAIENLSVNKDKLKAALDQSNALVEAEYTPNSWEASGIKTVTPAGQTVYDNPDATQKEVDDATQAILDAIAKLVKRADTSGLEDAIEDAGELKEEDYTPESWDDLEEAVTAGEKVLDDPNATQQEVNEAEEAIREAMRNLATPANKDALKAALEQSNDLVEEEYTPNSWEASGIETVTPAGQDVYDDPNATQQEVDDATKAILDAINDLVKRANKDALAEAITNANALVKDDYTPDSWTASNIETVTPAGQTVYNDPNATQEAVDAETQAIRDAIDALVKRADKDALAEAITDADALVKDDYTPESWEASNIEEVLADGKEVYDNPNATQQEVDDAAYAIREAIAALTGVADKSGLADAIADSEALNPDDYTPDSWTASNIETVTPAGQIVYDDPNASQEEVNAAEKAIRDAIDALVERADTSGLEDAIADAGELYEEDYTPNSWDDLEEAVTAGEEVLENPNATQDEVDAAEDAIRDAIDALAVRADKDALKAALDQSNALVEEDYTPNSWEASGIETVTPAGQDVYDDPNATQQEVNDATKAILDAIDALVKRADKSELEDALEDAKEPKEEDYTPESWKDLEDAIDEGEEVKDDPNATQEEVDEAEDAIREALENLTVDKSALKEALDQANALDEEDYTPNSWTDSNIETVTPAGQEVYNDPEAGQKEVDDATKAILDAIAMLVERADKEALEDAIEDAEALNPDDYTPNSWEASNIEEVLADGKEVFDDPNATQEAVDEAEAAIRDAIDALVERADTSGLEDAIEDAGKKMEEKYTPESWKNLEDAVDEGEDVLADPNATQDEVDEAEKAIRDALDALKTRPYVPPTHYVVVINANNGGKVSPSGIQYVTPGADLTITVTPDAGYRVKQVLIDRQTAVQLVNGSFTLKNITEPYTVDVIFEKIPVGIEVSKPTTPPATSNPQTGDNNFGFAMLALLLGGIAAVVVARKRQTTAK